MSEKNHLERSDGGSDELAVSRRSVLKTGGIFAGIVTIGSNAGGYLSQAALGSKPDVELGTETRPETDTLNVTADSVTTVTSIPAPAPSSVRTATPESPPPSEQSSATETESTGNNSMTSTEAETATETPSTPTIDDGDAESNTSGVYKRIVWEATGRLVFADGTGIRLSETA